MNRKNKKEYIEFETSELLSEVELKYLVSTRSPLQKAALLARKLGERIGIGSNDSIYIKYNEEYEESNITGDSVHKYILTMLRKLVDRSFCKFVMKPDRDPYMPILQKHYYEDLIDDIEYMLMWDEDQEDEDEEDQEDDDDETFDKHQPKVTVVDTIEEIMKFL